MTKDIAKKIALLCLIVSIAIFFSFGMFHLTKFETTDEHFWKYDRIGDYLEGVQLVTIGYTLAGIKKTRINDKPGVTTAIISGLGWVFIPNPEEHKIPKRDEPNYNVYHTEQTETINFGLRFPLLLFNTLSLVFFFWLIYVVTRSWWVTGTTTLLLGTSPILIGISQIINPDTLLWTFSFGAILSYVAFLRTKKELFLFITTTLTGLALLSKYTANILYVFYLFLFLWQAVLFHAKGNDIDDFTAFIRKQLGSLLIIALFSMLIFSLIMPAVFLDVDDFLYGTVLSPVLEPILFPFVAFLVLLLVDTYGFSSRGYFTLSRFLFRYRRIVYAIPSVLLLFLILYSVFNANFGTPFFPLDDLKETTREGGELQFQQLEGQSFLASIVNQVAVQSQNIIFSLPPNTILVSCILWIVLLIRGYRRHELLLFFGTLVPLIFITGGLFAGVFVNVRYAILVFPFFAFFTALGISELLTKKDEAPDPVDSPQEEKAKIDGPPLAKRRFLVWTTVLLLILGSQLVSLWLIKPFYFNYTSFLLPKEYVVTDSWGYGLYEAAQWLNQQPDAENLTIWADRAGVCQFFVGKCLRKVKIDLDTVPPPDYFVFTRRGVIRHKFSWKNQKDGIPDRSTFYSNQFIENPAFNLSIGDRPKNFVRIVSFEEVTGQPASAFTPPPAPERTLEQIEAENAEEDETEGLDDDE